MWYLNVVYLRNVNTNEHFGELRMTDEIAFVNVVCILLIYMANTARTALSSRGVI